MSAGRSCRALGAKDSTAVQSRPRKQTSERTRDRAELAKLGNCGNRGTVKIHGWVMEVSPVTWSPVVPPKTTGLSLHRPIHSTSASMFAACPA